MAAGAERRLKSAACGGFGVYMIFGSALLCTNSDGAALNRIQVGVMGARCPVQLELLEADANLHFILRQVNI